MDWLSYFAMGLLCLILLRLSQRIEKLTRDYDKHNLRLGKLEHRVSDLDNPFRRS